MTRALEQSIKEKVKTIARNQGRTPLFEKEIQLWAYPVESIFAEKLETAIARGEQNSRMKDYHDLLLLIRGDVIDRKKLKAVLGDTFANRGTLIQKLKIQKDGIDNTQKYWGSYLKSLDVEVRKELNENTESIMFEINKFLEANDLA